MKFSTPRLFLSFILFNVACCGPLALESYSSSGNAEIISQKVRKNEKLKLLHTIENDLSNKVMGILPKSEIKAFQEVRHQWLNSRTTQPEELFTSYLEWIDELLISFGAVVGPRILEDYDTKIKEGMRTDYGTTQDEKLLTLLTLLVDAYAKNPQKKSIQENNIQDDVDPDNGPWPRTQSYVTKLSPHTYLFFYAHSLAAGANVVYTSWIFSLPKKNREKFTVRPVRIPAYNTQTKKIVGQEGIVGSITFDGKKRQLALNSMNGYTIAVMQRVDFTPEGVPQLMEQYGSYEESAQSVSADNSEDNDGMPPLVYPPKVS